MKKFCKHLFAAALALVLLLTAAYATTGVPVTNVNEAVPGLDASAVEAETDLP